MDLLSDLVIRELKTEDYDAMIALWDEAGLPYRPKGRDSRQEIEQQLTESTAIYLAAELDGRLVGVVLGTYECRKGWINRLAVSPKHRNLGIARRLVEALESRFWDLGLKLIACLVEDWNKVSQEVSERLGYIKHPDVLYYSKRKDPDI